MSPVLYYGDGNPKERFQHFLDNPPAAISIDAETVSLKERMPLGFAIAFSPYEAIYLQVYPEPPPELALLAPLLSNPRVCKIAHNAMFDLGVMPMIPALPELDRSNLWDTNVAARLLGRLETALGILADIDLHRYDVEDAASLIRRYKAGGTMLDVPSEEVATKCQKDAKTAYALYLKYLPQIQELYPSYFQVEMSVIPILIDLSLRGILIDQQARATLEAQYEDEVEFYRRQVVSYGVDNPGSTQQVGYVLAKRGNFLPFTRSKKQLSTRVGELEFLDDPMAAAVLGYRKKSKFLSTYLKPLAGEERFYTEYYLDTLVGRLNSRNRNIQNIPSADKLKGDPGARFMLLPDNGLFTTGDYAQEHLYVLMHFSQDRDMKRVYEEGYLDGDIHKFTANEMGITRYLAKTINYAIVYGATAKTISEQAKIRDRNRCSRLLDGWFRTFPGAADWITSVQREGLRSGWAEPTLFGRRIRIPEESEVNMKNKAVNYPILGSDGEVIKRAILLCSRRGLGPPIMAITVHDSITCDGDVQFPVEELEMIPGFRIPYEVKQTYRWE